jgi:hypothetical protein
MRGRDDVLPLLLVDGKIAVQGRYPTREVLAALVGLEAPKTTGANAGGEQPSQACCAPSDASPIALSRPTGKKCC